MKVLWYCNVLLPKAAEAAKIKGEINTAGWIEGFLNQIWSDYKGGGGVLGVICPADVTGLIKAEAEDIAFYIVSRKSQIEQFKKILNDFMCDILHIFGTESPNSYDLIKLFGKPERTVINIQGMMGIYSQVYMEGMSLRSQTKERLFEKVIGNSLESQKRSLAMRGKTEKMILENVRNVIGRTDIDRMMALTQNPEIRYFHCNEILRDIFYHSRTWRYDMVETHSLFFRNTGNPIKELPGMLKALSILLKKYPDTKLYVVGPAIYSPACMKQKVVEGTFNRECREIMDQNSLWAHIEFMNSLDSGQMKERYLRSHAVVSASNIENESNVVSEAKILGVPVVASFVGGLPNRIKHGYDGFLYQFNLPQMLAYYISVIFDNPDIANRISKNAVESQRIINNPDTNIRRLEEIYQIIFKQ